MKLYKALKLKKSLIGEITKLKTEIMGKNSYLLGSKNGENFPARDKFQELLSKIDELTGLKFVINEANREIQSKIYVMSEHKALIAFWNGINVTEGNVSVDYGGVIREYLVHFTEEERNDLVKYYQKRVDALQDEIDVFNHTTDVPWGVDIESDEIN